MKKPSIYNILIVVLFFVTTITFGQQLSKDEAEKLITNFVELKSKTDFKILEIYAYKEMEVPDFYIAYFYPYGFVILANEKKSYPILAYSFNSGIDLENIPPAVLGKLDQYEFIIDFYRNTTKTPREEIKLAWKKLEEDYSLSESREFVDPLINTSWNQNRYYNDYCPVDSSVYPNMNFHTPAGCVAIAMAQLIKYHEHPLRGNGDECYNASPYGEQCAYFDIQDYLYDQMPDELNDYNDEIARLIYHCGVSVEMGYGTYGSYAFMPDVEYALVDHFRYRDEINREFKSNYEIDEWANMLISDIDMGLPVVMCGSGVNGTHAFICEGYDEDGLFHFNWGWGGSFDGYFEIGNLNPGPYHFDENQEGFFNVIPLITGIEDENIDTEFVVYPNPADEYFNISGWMGNTILRVEIFDINGELVKSFSNSDQSFSVKSLESGIYLVRIISAKSIDGFKIIKH